MSLTMMALRICAVEALKAANTLVGGNVLDSQISAFDLTADGAMRSDQQKPFIAVYTDAAKAQDIARSGPRDNGRVDILFNCGVSATMALTDKDTGDAEIVSGVPATDAHFEAVLDVLDVEIARALVDPDNPWAQVFGGFIQTYVGKEMLRSSSSMEKVRIAAGQVKLTVDVFADPAKDQVLPETGIWRRFLAQMEADNHVQQAMFQRLLSDGVAGPYEDFERTSGVTTAIAGDLMLYTFGGLAEPVKFEALDVDDSVA